MKTNNFKVIFFDLGNVLVNFNIDLFFSNLSIIADKSLDDIYKIAHNHSHTINQFNMGQLSPKDFFIQVTDSFQNVDYQQFKKAYTEIFDLNHAIVPVVKQLQGYIKLSIISNTDPLHFQYILDTFSIIDYFNEPVTSFEAKSLKPNANIYNYACNRFDIRPENAIFIDDKLENIQAANNIGMIGIHYKNVPQLVNSLTELGFKDLKTLEV